MNFVLTSSEVVYKAYMKGSYVGEIELIRGILRKITRRPLAAWSCSPC